MKRRFYEILVHLVVSLHVALAGKSKLKGQFGEPAENQKLKPGSLHLQLRAEKYDHRDLAIHSETGVDVEDLVRLIRAIAINHPEEIGPDDTHEKSKNYNHRLKQFFENNEEENEENYVDSQKTIYRYDKGLTTDRQLYEILVHLIVSLNAALAGNSELKKQRLKTGSLDVQLRAEKYDPRHFAIHVETSVDVEDLVRLIRAFFSNHPEEIDPAVSLGKSKNNDHRSQPVSDNKDKKDKERYMESQKTLYRYYQGNISPSPSVVYEDSSNATYGSHDEKEEGALGSEISHVVENDNSSLYNEDQSEELSNYNVNTNININGNFLPDSQPTADSRDEIVANNERVNETASAEEVTLSGKRVDENSDETMKPLRGILTFSGASANASREDDSSKRKYVMDVLLEAINAIIPRNMSAWMDPANTEKLSR